MKLRRQYIWSQSKYNEYDRMCEGGELFYYITKTQHLTEMQAAKIMR